MTSPGCQQLRQRIAVFMDSLSLPQAVGEGGVRREDGVGEFSKHGCVGGDHQQGVFASFTDCDEVIEFGLLQRDGETAVNLLHVHVTVVADVVADDDGAEVSNMSEFNMDMNFDPYITAEKQGRPQDAPALFRGRVTWHSPMSDGEETEMMASIASPRRLRRLLPQVLSEKSA